MTFFGKVHFRITPFDFRTSFTFPNRFSAQNFLARLLQTLFCMNESFPKNHFLEARKKALHFFESGEVKKAAQLLQNISRAMRFAEEEPTKMKRTRNLKNLGGSNEQSCQCQSP